MICTGKENEHVRHKPVFVVFSKSPLINQKKFERKRNNIKTRFNYRFLQSLSQPSKFRSKTLDSVQNNDVNICSIMGVERSNNISMYLNQKEEFVFFNLDNRTLKQEVTHWKNCTEDRTYTRWRRWNCLRNAKILETVGSKWWFCEHHPLSVGIICFIYQKE